MRVVRCGDFGQQKVGVPNPGGGASGCDRGMKAGPLKTKGNPMLCGGGGTWVQFERGDPWTQGSCRRRDAVCAAGRDQACSGLNDELAVTGPGFQEPVVREIAVGVPAHGI